MGLRLVFGRAGSGKTHFCLHEIKSGLETEDKSPLILIVPEQFSLQAERSLIKTTGKGGIIRAEVLSFQRMAYRVFNEAGGLTRRHINAAGKCMMLFRDIDSVKGGLGIFSKAASQKGFVNTISDLIAEFKRYDITPEKLESISLKADEGSPLTDKLKDIALIYSQFDRTLRQRYMDSDDDLTELYNKLDRSTQFNGAEIWIDEFSGFTPQEYKIIRKLLEKAKRVSICLCTDYLETEGFDIAGLAFSSVRDTAARLCKLAKEANIVIETPVKTGKEGVQGMQPVTRFSGSKELSHLEQFFYAYPYGKYTGNTTDISVFSAANIFSEVEETARDIIRLGRESNIKYRDIAVVSRSLDRYEKLIRAIFKEYGIPFFVDRKRDINSHPLVILILSSLEIFSSSWSYEAVFKYIKTGLSNLDRESSDLLENYVLANGIRGNQWTQEGDWGCRYGGGREVSEYEQLGINRVNAARRAFTGPLVNFRSKTRGRRTAAEICTALFDLLCETGIPERMDVLVQRFSMSGELDKANEYHQVWNIVMEVFTQIVEVTGEDTMGIERFSEILATGFAEYNIGLIPPAIDQVLVGSVERSKSHEIKALYILGVNDGIFPAAVNEEGILTDAERELLGRFGVELAKDSRSRSLEEKFLVYTALTTPSEFLRLSYPAADHDGRAMRPSRVISDMRRIFPDICEHSSITGRSGKEDDLGLLAAPAPAFNAFVSAIRQRCEGFEVNGVWKDVYRWFAGEEAWRDRCDSILSGLSYSNQANPIDAERAGRLYGSPVYTSVSRMETYASCPFSYYIKYGLKAKERSIFKLNPMDVGTFMHQVIDTFSKKVVSQNMNWRDLQKDWCTQQVSLIVDGLLAEMTGNVLNSSKRYIYLSGRLKRIITRAVLLISEHIRRSSFDPVGYEVEFGEGGRYPPITIELPSGERVNLTGRIDRIDSMVTDDGTYLRIVDYKSGSRELKLSDVYYGLQIQLLTYMDAVLGMSAGAGALPGGVLYFRLDDPVVKGTRMSTEEEIEQSIMKALKMKGLLLADVKLVKEMDRQIDGDSLIIPARLNKGDVLGRSSTATEEQFGLLRSHVRKMLVAISTEMLKGNVAISPYKKRTNTACTFCSFLPVCQFDPVMKDNRYRVLNDMKDEEAWKLIREDSSKQAEEGETL